MNKSKFTKQVFDFYKLGQQSVTGTRESSINCIHTNNLGVTDNTNRNTALLGKLMIDESNGFQENHKTKKGTVVSEERRKAT